MQVQKQTGTNSVEVAELVKKKISELEKTLPPDIKIQIIFDTAEDIINSLNTLKETVWIAITLVIFIVWFFLRQFSPSMIIALTIPFSLLITFVYLFFQEVQQSYDIIFKSWHHCIFAHPYA
jgi:HAE1 family hydrophobic/amphiphilic exporter-1